MIKSLCESGLQGAELDALQSGGSRKEGAAISLLHTLALKESGPDGAAQRWDDVLRGVGAIDMWPVTNVALNCLMVQT